MSTGAAANIIPERFAPEDAAVLPSRSSWLAERRAEALRAFEAQGVPHRRVEEWKYSDLRTALDAGRSETDETVARSSPDPFAALDGPRLVISNGRLDMYALPEMANVDILDFAALGDDGPKWVTDNLGRILKNGMGDASLAWMRGGVGIRIRSGAHARLHLRFLQQVETVQSRVLIEIEDGASLQLLESHGGFQGVSNLGLEILLRPAARLMHVRLADAMPDAVLVEEIGVAVARGANYRAHYPQAGAKLSRLELTVNLAGEDAEAVLNGAGVLGGKLHADVTTHIEHAAGKTVSRQLFKYIAGGHSRAVYQGKVSVRKGADGSDSRQTAKAILAGDRAEADLKPELEILADDVKCAHGAAIGDLDNDSLFYLRARGIPETEARELLVRAFLEETVAEIADEDIRSLLWNFIESHLSGALDAAA